MKWTSLGSPAASIAMGMTMMVAMMVAMMMGCGSIVETRDRDDSTRSYADQVDRVPSFWTEDIDGEILIPFYVRDDVFPSGVDPDYLRQVVRGAIDEWLAPLDEAGRRVVLPVVWASASLPPPARRVEVFYIRRGEGFLGITRYDGELVQVELSVRAQNVDRFLLRRELQALTLHEFGHALGISQPGHSTNSNDVMFGHNLASTWITLSTGDRATLLELFPD